MIIICHLLSAHFGCDDFFMCISILDFIKEIKSFEKLQKHLRAIKNKEFEKNLHSRI